MNDQNDAVGDCRVSVCVTSSMQCALEPNGARDPPVVKGGRCCVERKETLEKWCADVSCFIMFFTRNYVKCFTVSQASNNIFVTCIGRRAREVFFDWGVKIMRATFRGVHKSVINDNKKHILRPSFRI